MFCSHCGSQIGENDRFCPGCGYTAVTNAEPQKPVSTELPYTSYAPTSPASYPSYLLPIQRHPLFFTSALIFLALSVYDAILWGPALSFYASDLQFHFLDLIHAIVLIAGNCLIVVSLLLLAIGGLTKSKGATGAASSFMVIALCLHILGLALHIYDYVEYLIYVLDIPWTDTYFEMIRILSDLMISTPITLLTIIFALRTNGIARSMSDGRRISIGSGLAVMLLVRSLLLILFELFFCYMNMTTLTYFYRHTLLFQLPPLCFAILLLIKRKTK